MYYNVLFSGDSRAFKSTVDPDSLNYCPPKAGVTGSNPVGRAIFFKRLGQYPSDGTGLEWTVKSTVSPNGRDNLSHLHLFGESEIFLKMRETSAVNVYPQLHFVGPRAPVLTGRLPHIVSYAIITQRATKPRTARVNHLYSCQESSTIVLVFDQSRFC